MDVNVYVVKFGIRKISRCDFQQKDWKLFR